MSVPPLLDSQSRKRQSRAIGGCVRGTYASVLFLHVETTLAAKISALAPVATWFQSLLKGEGGLIASLLAILIAVVYVAVKKDWSALLGAVLLALGLGLIVDMIVASFSACV